MKALLESLSKILWGRGTILFVLGVGLFFTVGAGFLPLVHARTVCKKTVGSLFRQKKGGISPFAAMSAALGGTMGVGNIIGVGAALELGGAGAIFWMWVGAFVGMMTKYAEVLLAVRHREFYSVPQRGGTAKGNQCNCEGSSDSSCGVLCRGGPMYYMTRAYSGKMPGGKLLAGVFCTACILGSMGTGNMTQTNAISRSLQGSFGLPPLLTAGLIVLLCGWVVLGGAGRIVKVAAAVVPAMALLYLLGAFAVLGQFWENILPALQQILNDAFRPESAPGAAVGGVAGLFCSGAVRVGISRGIFTNEAGLGSAPIAHACAHTDSCVEQGFWGIFEVFADTIVVCTMTALVILVSGVPFGADATGAAFSLVFGQFGDLFLSLALCFFAIASVFTWCLYGQRAVEFLFPEKPAALLWFNRLFLAGCFCGCVADISSIWLAADILNACLLLPNLISLLLLSPLVFRETSAFFYEKESLAKKTSSASRIVP